MRYRLVELCRHLRRIISLWLRDIRSFARTRFAQAAAFSRCWSLHCSGYFFLASADTGAGVERDFTRRETIAPGQPFPVLNHQLQIPATGEPCYKWWANLMEIVQARNSHLNPTCAIHRVTTRDWCNPHYEHYLQHGTQHFCHVLSFSFFMNALNSA